MFFESEICQLEPNTQSELNVKIKIPKESDSHFYVILLKIKTSKKSFAGPNLVAFIKLIDPEKVKADEEREHKKQAADEQLASSSLEISTFQETENLIREGHDVYEER